MKRTSEGFSEEKSIKFDQFVGKSTTLYFLEDVSVSYNSIFALKNVNLKISSGDFIFLTGASGAGKTSLMNVLSGDVRPNSGRLLNFIKDSQGMVGRVFQDLRLIADWTIEENLFLAFDKNIYKSTKKFTDDLHEYVQALNMKSKLQLPINQANGGLKQKVAIVRCLLKRPTVILADEPTSSLDREQTLRVFELFKLLNKKRGTTIVWASHNAELVRQMQGKIIHLDQGKLLYSGNACFI